MAAPAKLVALREMDGIIKLSWDGDTTNPIRIQRREFDYPQDINEGDTVFAGLTSSLSNPNELLDPLPGPPDTIYYYRFFEEISPGIHSTRQRLTDHDWKLDPDGFNPVLRRVIPNMYDKSRDVKDKPQLWNLIRDVVIGLQIGYQESLIDNLTTGLDVDVADGHNLSSMAAYIGLKPNRELTFTLQRQEIEAAVSSYKVKGTATGLAQQVKAVSGAQSVDIADWNLNILRANCTFILSAQINPPIPPRDEYEMSTDPTGHAVDFDLIENYTFGRYGVWVQILKTAGITQSQVQKICRVLGDFQPADMLPTVQILDSKCLEDPIGMAEVAIYDQIETQNLELIVQSPNKMISNDLDFESNSLTSLSCYNGIQEFWYDVITVGDPDWLISNSLNGDNSNDPNSLSMTFP